MVAAVPTHSSAWSAPRPPVSARTRAGRSSPAARKQVAPIALASGSLPVAEATADRPTPPSPMTTTDSPARTPAVRQAAPTPVSTAHPSRAATSGAIPPGSGTTARSGTTISSANAPTPRQAWTGVPSASRPAGRAVTPSVARHSHGSPCRQNQHARQAGAQFSTTWSPGATRVTSGPASITVPDASWPSTRGYGARSVPSVIDRSEWQTPAAAICTRTPRRPASAGSTPAISGPAPASRTTTARTSPPATALARPPGARPQAVRPSRGHHGRAGQHQRGAAPVRAERHQRVAGQPERLRRRRHVREHVPAPAGARQRVEVGQAEHGRRAGQRQGAPHGEPARRAALPEQDGGGQRGGDVRADLRRVDL